MQSISARVLLAGLKKIEPAQDVRVTAVVTDSRRILPGCVFVCFKGARVDGHDFAAAAAEADAAFVVAEHPVDGVPAEKLVVVDSSLHAMVAMGANYRAQFSPVVVGVTGSVGKTTTKEFCYAVFSAFGETLKTAGNQNNEIGMPNTLFRLSDETKYAVVEMGMSALGEISRLTRAARPDVGLITCIGVSHMESLGSRENILKAKLELCEGMPEGAPLVLNADDEYLANAALPGHVRPVWVSLTEGKGDVWAENVRTGAAGMEFTVCDKKHGRFETSVPTVGRHNLYNALEAYAAAVALGLDAARAAAALERYETTGMRQHLVQCEGVSVIEDCYNASPDSMRAGFAAMQELAGKRRCALLGDMLELGSVSDQAHREAGQLAAKAGVQLLVCCGPLSAQTAEAAREAGVAEVLHCESHEEAAAALADRLQSGDVLLAKGSRGMQLETVLQMVYEALRERSVEQ